MSCAPAAAEHRRSGAHQPGGVAGLDGAVDGGGAGAVALAQQGHQLVRRQVAEERLEGQLAPQGLKALGFSHSIRQSRHVCGHAGGWACERRRAWAAGQVRVERLKERSAKQKQGGPQGLGPTRRLQLRHEAEQRRRLETSAAAAAGAPTSLTAGSAPGPPYCLAAGCDRAAESVGGRAARKTAEQVLAPLECRLPLLGSWAADALERSVQVATTSATRPGRPSGLRIWRRLLALPTGHPGLQARH